MLSKLLMLLPWRCTVYHLGAPEVRNSMMTVRAYWVLVALLRVCRVSLILHAVQYTGNNEALTQNLDV